MSALAELVGQRVLLLDAAMGSQVQAMTLDVERDFDGCENCTEVLNRTRPDIVREIHRASLAAGSDAIETNSFGGSPITLGEFGLADEARALNLAAARIAREAADEFSADGRPRFVFGAIGPGTRLPTLEQVSWADVADAVAVQAAGLIAGGADALLIETVQDLLQAKAAVAGARRALAEAKRDMPLVAQVTVESTGTLLAGADIAAAATVLHALDVEIAGLNCATGPQEMAEHLSWLSQNWPGPISVLPNAGLPELVGGETRYPLSADELAEWLARFVEEDGVALVGGCCGTTAEHVAALDAMLRARAEDGFRPRVRRREARWTPSVASLYGQTPLRQETALLAIGERCNANGSRKFRALQKDRAWDACVAVGREQAAEGSHCIDLCTALVGEDETEAMCALVGRMGRAVAAPLVIDSTELGVIEAALARYGGKAIINSINFEDGEGPAAARLALARRFGAAAVALTIDEEGMAKTAAEKLRIARRLAEFAAAHGLPAADLLIDPLTFTICTGNEEDRGLAAETLDAIAAIAEALPDCQIVLGLSNVSFGLKPAARHVLNSVFLDHARRRGMTAALLHPGKIAPLHRVPEAEAQAAEDLIFDRRRPGYDPLHAFIALFEGRDGAAPAKRERPAKVEDRLSRRIVDGDRDGLESDLEEAMRDWRPLDIVNRFLLDGMKTVGELFGSGAMQLPFVLQSAETMKAAVRWLEPHMDRVDGGARGTIVLATVKGDVHDIGKNLTDIILTNNGFRVVNLGIKQPIARILEAADEHGADCIGMSGLLVKSTAIMRENLLEMSRRGLDFPVLLGGAALTRRYVEEDCAAAYEAGAGGLCARRLRRALADGRRVEGALRRRSRGEPRAPAADGRRRAADGKRAGGAGAAGGADAPAARASDRGCADACPRGVGGAADRPPAARRSAAVSEHSHALSASLGLQEAGTEFPRVPRVVAEDPGPDARSADRTLRRGGDPDAERGVGAVAGGRRRRRSGAALARRPFARGGALYAAAAEGQRRAVHRRFRARRGGGRARCRGVAGGDGGRAGVGGGARILRRRSLPRLSLSARAGGGDGGGDGGIHAQAHPRGTRLRPRGRARHGQVDPPRLSRRALFVRLSRLPAAGGPGTASGPSRRGGDRRPPGRRGAARARAVDLGSGHSPPARAVFHGIAPAARREAGPAAARRLMMAAGKGHRNGGGRL